MLVYDINNTKQYTDGMETLQKYIPPTETLKYVGLNSIDEKLFEQMTQAKKVVSVSRQLNDMISQLMNLNGKKHLNKEKSLTIFDADYLNKTAIEFEYEDYKFSIMCFYHPAFAIDGNQLGGAANYILKIKNHLDLEFKDSEFVCHTAKNYSELYDYVVPKVQSGKYTKVSYDIESNFKSPYSKDFKIVGFSLSFDGIEGIYAQLESFEDSMTDEDREKSLGLLKWVLSNEKLGIIVHNLMYELPTTLNNLGYEIPRTRLDDTMVMSKIINTSGRIGGNGLKDQGIMKLGLSDWSRDLDDFRKAVQDSIDNFKKLYGSRGKNFKTSIDLYDLSNDEILTDLLEKYNYDKDEIANMLKDYGRRVRENLKEDKEDYLSYGWVPSKLLSKYGAIDAIATRKLYDYFTEEMKSDSIKYNVDLFDGYSVYIESHYAGYQLELNSFCYDLKQAQLEEKAYRNVMRYDLVRLLSADKQEMKTHLEKVLRPKICKIYVENHIEEIESLSLGQTSTAYRYLDSEGNSKLVKKNKYVEICNVFNINRNKLYGELKKYIEYQIATKFQDLTYEEVVDLINPNTDESKELLVKLLSNEYIGGASFIINSLPYVVSQAYEVDKANKKYNPEEIEVFEIIKKYDEARLPEEKYKLFDNVIDQLKACRIGPTLASKLQEGGRWTMSTIDEANMTDLYDRLLLTGIDPDKDYERECEFSYLYSLRRYKKVYKVWTTYVLGDKLGISQVSEVEQLPMIRGDKLVRRERKSLSVDTSTEDKTFMYQGTWKPNSVLSGRWASPIHTLPSMNGDTKRYMITRFKGGCIAAPDLCLSGDTLVPLLDGTTRSIKDLVGLDEFYLYSYDYEKKEIVVGRGHSARLIRKTKDMVKLTLDNGKVIDCTPEHKFYTYDTEEWVEAKDLAVGQSMMPIRFYESNGRKAVRYNPKNAKKGRKVYHLSDAYNIESGIYEDGESQHIHHLDYSKTNDDPRNLTRLDSSEHIRLHRERDWSREGYREDQSRATVSQWSRSREEMLGYASLGGVAMTKKYNSDEHYIGLRKKGMKKATQIRMNYIIGMLEQMGLVADSNTWEELTRQVIGPEKSMRGFGIRSIYNNYGSFERFIDQMVLDKYCSKEFGEECKWREKFRVGTARKVKRIYQFYESLGINPTANNWAEKKSEFRELGGCKYQWRDWSSAFSSEEDLHRFCRSNHRIVSIEFITHEEDVDTYCLTVDKHHNFFLEAGILTSNSQAELRTVAKAAEEDMMLEAYRQGIDIHMKTAMGIFRKPASEVTEAERRYSKMCSFMILYGGSPKSLADQFLKGDMNMGLQLYNGFFEAYPKLRSWLDDRIKEVQDTGFITNMTGRHIRMGYARNDREKADLVRQSGNIPIQGSSSDIASSALYNIIDFITSKNLKSKAICFIHDSVEFDLAPDELFYTMEQIQYRMNNYPDERFGVPAKSDIVLGYSMGEECKVKKVTYSPDYSEGELHLEGLGECLLRLMWSWSHYFNVEFEIENYKEKKAPLAEIFGVKRTAHLRMGQIIPELDIIVKLTKKKFEQPEYDMIEGNLIPFKYYDCKMWRDWWINNSSGGKEKVVQKYDDSIVIMGLPKEEFGY